jgi:hypothetical protein
MIDRCLIQARLCGCLIGAAVLVGSLTLQGAAQVVIEMPAPPMNRPSPSLEAAAQSIAPQPVVIPSQIDVGELALRRYSRGRTYPYDTYWNWPMYNGYQQYNYSYAFPLVWWGWGGFWPFWGGGCCVSVCP